MPELTDIARAAIKNGSIKIRVSRSGMFQQLTFVIRKTKLGNIEYTELHTDRQIDMSELVRISGEVGLPVAAQNARAFPKSTSALDFQNL